MMKKISVIVLVLSLAMNFALAGLWASGGLHHMLDAGAPTGRGWDAHEHRRPEEIHTEVVKPTVPLAGAAVNVLEDHVWRHADRGGEKCGRRRKHGRPDKDGHRGPLDGAKGGSGFHWRNGKGGWLSW